MLCLSLGLDDNIELLRNQELAGECKKSGKHLFHRINFDKCLMIFGRQDNSLSCRNEIALKMADRKQFFPFQKR